MSEFKIRKLTDRAGTGAPNFTHGFNINGSDSGLVGFTHTEGSTEPSTPSNGDTWWDTGNDKYYVYVDSIWREYAVVKPPTFRGYTQGVFTSTQNEQLNLSMPTGTSAGDYAILVVGGLVWGGSSSVTIDNGSFGSPTNYQWGYQSGQTSYMTDLYTDSSISSSLVTSGVTISNNDSGTEYKLATLLTFANTTPLHAHTMINYGGNSNGTYYQVASGTRPTGYDSLSGGGIIEVHTTREGTRTYVDANDGANYSDFLASVNRGSIYLQAVYQNYSDNSNGYGQPYHRYLYNGGTVYSSSSVVIAY